MAISRRQALQFSGAVAAATAISGCTKKDEVKSSESKSASGLSVAKYTKVFAPEADVVLVEQRQEFISCPMSNLWLVDNVDLEYLTHDYLQAARNNNYTYFQASATGIDKKNNVLHTSNGDIDYDYIVFAPGLLKIKFKILKAVTLY